MIPMRFLWLVAALALVPAAKAQTDGCVQADPCILDVEVDEQGIASVSITTMTTGDWFVLAVSNLDERSHTVSFAGATVQVEAFGYRDSAPFAAPASGTYSLTDSPSGDAATIAVVAGDSLGASNEPTGIPSFGAASALMALACAAVLWRR